MDPDQTAPLGTVGFRVHTVCLYAKNRFEKFARIFSSQHKQMTFSDAGFHGILRVNSSGKHSREYSLEQPDCGNSNV